MNKHFPNLFAVLQALLVTFLWSTSFIIIKWGLAEIPPVTFAGYRYFLAFIIFAPFVFKQNYRTELFKLNRTQIKKLVLLGIVFYFFTQGTLFLGLSLLPAVTVSLMLNFTPLVVATLGIFFLKEIPSKLQWIGAVLFVFGILVYFYPIGFSGSEWIGILVMIIGVMANSGSAILGRDINRNRDISPLVVTFVSMGIGAILLLIVGLSIEGFSSLSLQNFLFLLWLAAINTAFAFTLWNLTLRTLTAMESSIINGTMLIQIAILAWFFIDEKITMQEGIGMVIAAIGAVLVQLRRNKNTKH
ncbi:MAG: hypothetical protein FJ213_04340 [Ignavibacteria bacterium]|nr:hypothetical protein [Ignavibacteria bacterium]